MRFDINEYAGRFAMHCKTEDEAKTFCNYLRDKGKQWCSGESYEDTKYHEYNNGMVYYFNENACSSVTYAKEDHITITLEFSDFDWSKEFTKADLKTGDVVLRKNGDVEIVNRDLEIFISENGWMNFDTLRDDLTEMFYDNEDGEWDIIAVRRPTEKHHCQFTAFSHNLGELVYERKEPEEMTLAQVCKLLGKEIKIIP